MRCPRLNELPAPPPGQTGWPWTEESTPLDDRRPDGSPRPRVTVVTPSYDQGRFLEGAIRSVLLQGYLDVELIVIDGGSTDDSVAIIRRYEKWIACWVSERDRGQSHATNKGFERATGEIRGWLCSDDLLAKDALSTVGGYFADHPDCRWLGGATDFVELETGRVLKPSARIEPGPGLIHFWRFGTPGYTMPQPSIFWRKSLWDEAGTLREELHLSMDFDLWLRFEEKARLQSIGSVLAIGRLYEGCKTVNQTVDQMREAMRAAYEAAERRGCGRLRLTCRMFIAMIPRHASRFFRNLAARHVWFALRNLAALIASPVCVWSENGRLRLLGFWW